jgi:hypothetical protein
VADEHGHHDEYPGNHDADNKPTQLRRDPGTTSTNGDWRKSIACTNDWFHAFPQNAQPEDMNPKKACRSSELIRTVSKSALMAAARRVGTGYTRAATPAKHRT